MAVRGYEVLVAHICQSPLEPKRARCASPLYSHISKQQG
jgi:hypothetical protein